MQHARIALYDLTSGSFDEVANRAERGLLKVFEAQPGFRAYGLTRVDHTLLISISLWATEAQAYAATETAAAWVEENVADHVRLRATHVGGLAFWSAVAADDFVGLQRPIPG
jgi:heme-degrading monooxygenase HmoA